MELGLTLVGDATDTTPAEASAAFLELCRTAEQSGLQTLWFTEHHHNPTRMSSTIPVLMAAAGAQTSLNLGAATLLPGLHDTTRMAESMGTLESLYPGRLLWGFGKGGRSEILYTHLEHITPENAREEMMRNLRSLLALRGSEEVMPPLSHDTPWFVATRDTAAVQLAAENGLGVMFGHKWPLEELVGIVSTYRSAHPEGRAPAIMLSRYFLCDSDGEQVQRRMTEEVGKRREHMRRRGRSLGEASGEGIRFRESLVGTPQECRERMAYFRAMGVTHLSLRPVSTCHEDTAASLVMLAQR
ncbi:LLM class flavin-dependent oxidoreductase [Sulfurimonas sp. HSL3-7]|uniref:LLM class flavin-dependent oxidoreductase n=1 Tax=Sulfonitrofixus jiaomeiensis TaxID=3131938 RepID=UPI0031F8CAEB